MAISKRTRYEVLRRDNHACRYCGGIAPDVKLTVDHVTPVALGGSDSPDNLVAACVDCNAGKSSTTTDAAIVANVNADALRWSKAVQVVADRALSDHKARKRRRAAFLRAWHEWDSNGHMLPADWKGSVDQWSAAGLPLPLILDSVDLAMSNPKVSSRQVFRYLAGVCWSRIRELHDDASKEVSPRLDVDLQGPDLIADFIDRRWTDAVERSYLRTVTA